MSQEFVDAMLNQPRPGRATALRQRARLENMTVTTLDGRVFDLGSPDHKLFRARVLIYRMRRKFHG